MADTLGSAMSLHPLLTPFRDYHLKQYHRVTNFILMADLLPIVKS